MSRSEKKRFLYEHFFWEALSTLGQNGADEYANRRVREIMGADPRKDMGVRAGSKAGRRQARERGDA